MLADSTKLVGWDVGGAAAMGVFKPDLGDGANPGQVFNCGTTDWPRVLMDENASSHAIVARITLNVMRNFVGLAAQDASLENTALGEPAACERNEHAAPIGAGNS
jgi:hypothetical protein